MSADTNTKASAPEHVDSATASGLAPATLAIHADDVLNTATDVAPALHVSTTFRFSRNVDELVPAGEVEIPSTTDPHIYSRLTAPNSTRFESILNTLLSGRTLTYTSGLSAFNALLIYFRPNVIAISGGYHGCHGVISIHHKLYGLRTVDLFASDAAWDEAGLGKGDIVHVETPLNPVGEARDLAHFAERAKRRGAVLTCDATFAPPPLLDPFRWGVDVVMHSGTKYIGGHSDMLCGVLAVPEGRKDWWEGLGAERVFLGSVLGSLEGWLGVRSLRTLDLRVRAQSRNAELLAKWLGACLDVVGIEQAKKDLPEIVPTEEEKSIVSANLGKVQHASLQALDPATGPWLKEQMSNGFGPVFAILAKSAGKAKTLPSKLHLFHHATSLGGVESLIEWRRMSDTTVEEGLLRLSIGAENWWDLRRDLVQGLKDVRDVE